MKMEKDRLANIEAKRAQLLSKSSRNNMKDSITNSIKSKALQKKKVLKNKKKTKKQALKDPKTVKQISNNLL